MQKTAELESQRFLGSNGEKQKGRSKMLVAFD